MLRRFLLLGPCAALLLLSPADGRSFEVREAAASVSLALTLEQLAHDAQRVVLGSPAEAHTVWEDVPGGGRRIVTYTRLRIERTVVGPDAPDAWVRTLGGRVGDVGQTVDGEAQVGAGPALLFLHERGDGTQEVLGMAQGHYPIREVAGGVRRLFASPAQGEIVPRDERHPPALRVLPGLLVDEAVERVLAARKAP